MRLVTFEELKTMPGGTIYCMEDCGSSVNLQRKGVSDDSGGFYTKELLPAVSHEGTLSWPSEEYWPSGDLGVGVPGLYTEFEFIVLDADDVSCLIQSLVLRGPELTGDDRSCGRSG